VSPNDAAAAIADALAPLTVEIPELQIYGYYNGNPSPPSIDIYPGEPFQAGAGFGVGEKQVWFTVRALAPAADFEAASQLLYRLLDPNGPAGVEAALQDVAVVDNASEVSGIRPYADVVDTVGCQWRVGLFLTPPEVLT
jgi:hypothetical protein